MLFAIHGLTGTGPDFRYLAGNLAATGWQVCAPDLPGRGLSSKAGSSSAYSLNLNNLTLTFDAVPGHFNGRHLPVCFLGSSVGSGLLAAYLAVRKLPAAAVIPNDNALEFDAYLMRCLEYLRNEPRSFGPRRMQ